jgi:hypothetical protein
MIQQVTDFRDESEALYGLMQPLDEEAFDTVTQFKRWTFNDILGHLHLWNHAADLSLADEAAFQAFLGEVMQSVARSRGSGWPVSAAGSCWNTGTASCWKWWIASELPTRRRGSNGPART